MATCTTSTSKMHNKPKPKVDIRVERNRVDRDRIVKIVSEKYHHHVGRKLSRSHLKIALSQQLGHVTDTRLIGESIKSVYGSNVTISTRKVKRQGAKTSMSFYVGLCAKDSCNAVSRPDNSSPARQVEAVYDTAFNNRKNDSDADRSTGVTGAFAARTSLDSESNGSAADALSGQLAEGSAKDSSRNCAPARSENEQVHP